MQEADMRFKLLISLFIVALVFSFSTFFWISAVRQGIRINSAFIAKGVDQKLKPVQITNAFTPGTSQFYCWFAWRNAQPNTAIISSWHYLTDDIHILDYTFAIPRKSGQGSVSLAMPAGKEFPAGMYRVDLKKGKSILCSLTFKVLEKS